MAVGVAVCAQRFDFAVEIVGEEDAVQALEEWVAWSAKTLRLHPECTLLLLCATHGHQHFPPCNTRLLQRAATEICSLIYRYFFNGLSGQLLTQVFTHTKD